MVIERYTLEPAYELFLRVPSSAGHDTDAPLRVGQPVQGVRLEQQEISALADLDGPERFDAGEMLSPARALRIGS